MLPHSMRTYTFNNSFKHTESLQQHGVQISQIVSMTTPSERDFWTRNLTENSRKLSETADAVTTVELHWCHVHFGDAGFPIAVSCILKRLESRFIATLDTAPKIDGWAPRPLACQTYRFEAPRTGRKATRPRYQTIRMTVDFVRKR
jgi:hypothetical protein